MGYRDLVDGPCPGSYLPGTALPYVRDRGALVTGRWLRCIVAFVSPRRRRNLASMRGHGACIFLYAGRLEGSVLRDRSRTKHPSSNAPYHDLAQGFDGLRVVADPGLRAAAGPLIWFLKWNLFNSGGVAAIGGHRWREV